MFAPSKIIVPSKIVVSPKIDFTRVLFPDPFGPTIAMKSPSLTVREMFWTIVSFP